MRKLILLLGLATLPLHSSELDELRIEIDDLKYALKTTQVDLGILDERLKKQDVKSQNKDVGTLSLLASQVSTLEKKVSSLEKTLEKAANDLRSLSAASTQALAKIQEFESNISSHEKRLDEVGKLKGTLTNISKAIGQRTESPATSSQTYRVKAGDSLEKIARSQHVSVDALRKVNNLSNDKIVVGQELRLPDASR